MTVLSKEFYEQNTEIVAKELLGKIFVFGDISGKIVETEAYIADNDLANHSSRGKTNRNAAMFANGGILYVYKIYGIHHCINVVTETEGRGSAVLIRALQPLGGIEQMQINRNAAKIDTLCKGPANFAKAFGINLSHNFKSLLSEEIYILNSNKENDQEIVTDSRIGISKSSDLLLRFYYANCKYVSGKKIK